MSASVLSEKSEALDTAAVEQLRRDGFTAVEQFLDAGTLATLRDYYDRIVKGEIKLPGDRQLGGVTRQVMHPRLGLDYFKDNPALRRGLAVARGVFGSDAELCFDMMIYKPPMHPKSTPWHQDFAYVGMPFEKEGTPIDDRSLQFWVALDDVDVANGCMHFVPGLQFQGLKEHYVYAGDPKDEGRLLATRAFGDPDLPNDSVACPLPAGGCTIHFHGAPHYTPPNVTADRGRRAYIFNIQKRNRPSA